MNRLLVFLFTLILLPLQGRAQYNTDRLITIGRSALYYEDYVLSMHYFNQAIAAKPYLYEPWFFRGVAKYYLDDFAGAEADCNEAVQRNPYVVNIYELRGLCRIRQEKYAEAAADYTQALKYDPDNQNHWHNRVLCRIHLKDYDLALNELDTLLGRWKKSATGYGMQAEVYMLQGDTVKALVSLDKSLELDPYDAQTWAARSMISLARSEWKDAEGYLDKAVHLQPKTANYYLNRALARVNQNNLRGAMSDYDTTLDLNPNDYLGHYNRGLLRAQVGDDNRAITDFDFVLRLEPDNITALVNRAILREKTGDLRGAITDYSKVINEYPNFWTGLQNRARCYRRLGMTKQAEADEFRVYKAQLYKHLYGTQPRLRKDQLRKRSDADPDKYNQLVVEDQQEMTHEYASEYRGRVQNRKVEMAFLPMYELSFDAPQSDVRSNVMFDHLVDAFNQASSRQLYINNHIPSLDEQRSQTFFADIDALSGQLATAANGKETARLLMLRAVAYAALQNYEGAIDDLSVALQSDSTYTALLLWQRAVCQSKLNAFNASQGTNIDMKTANVLGDFSNALQRMPQNAFLYYNRGTLYAQRREYVRAIDDFTRALDNDRSMGEAYYNRGLALIQLNRISEGVADLSKAGELGIYDAYSVLKKYRNGAK